MAKKNELNQRQKNFVDNFVANGGLVALAYSDAYGQMNMEQAQKCGNRLLKLEKVQKYLDEVNEKLDKEKILTMNECLTLLKEIAYDKENERVSTADRLSAIDKRLKTLGAYIDRKQVDANVNTTVITVSLEGEEEE